ncbi:MAG TPA: GNAT family N-acetyltransferase [Candidatus Acidoferrales bacterium]|jgi:RimJ/RimL family protein N-acetyltransferase|nr:GNAT family N-acetyltransferase [Candidatus Acidoferrales bacterium]
MLETRRLLLRRWRDSDREAFAALNGDPRVMQHFPAVLSRAESDRIIDRIESHFDKHGFGLFAAELRQEGGFIGFVGLSIPDFEAPFTPCVEIGWRLAAEYWNQGLATEGAKAVLGYAFDSLHLDEVVSFTTVANASSRRVMEKLGMARSPEDDFDHPKLPEGHPLRRHVLYRISQ